MEVQALLGTFQIGSNCFKLRAVSTLPNFGLAYCSFTGAVLTCMNSRSITEKDKARRVRIRCNRVLIIGHENVTG